MVVLTDLLYVGEQADGEGHGFQQRCFEVAFRLPNKKLHNLKKPIPKHVRPINACSALTAATVTITALDRTHLVSVVGRTIAVLNSSCELPLQHTC